MLRDRARPLYCLDASATPISTRLLLHPALARTAGVHLTWTPSHTREHAWPPRACMATVAGVGGLAWHAARRRGYVGATSVRSQNGTSDGGRCRLGWRRSPHGWLRTPRGGVQQAIADVSSMLRASYASCASCASYASYASYAPYAWHTSTPHHLYPPHARPHSSSSLPRFSYVNGLNLYPSPL